MNKYYPKLFEKGQIGHLTVRNRLIRNSMGTYLAHHDCSVSDRNIKAGAQAAAGGMGVVFLDNSVVKHMYHMGVSAADDSQIPVLSMLAEAIKDRGAIAGMQLAHPGRDTGFVGGTEVVAASPITYEPWYEAGAKLPKALTIDEIHTLVGQFGDAAFRVKKAGFDIVEIHAAAGCIPTNFLSPHDNKRTDMYGGSLHNRMRFLLEIIRDIKKKCGPDFPISVKISMDDWEPEGIRIEESLEVAKALEREGVAILNLMSGTHATATAEFLKTNCYGAEMTKKFHDALHIPVMAGGNIFSPDEAEKLLEDGVADFVALGRSQLADPEWAKKAKEGRAEDIKPCINCLIGCMDHGLMGNVRIHCTVNPSLYKFEESVDQKPEPKNVAIVGGGPAGCEAALDASKLGHSVTLYEKRKLGGLMYEASVPDHKMNIRRLIHYYETQIEKDDNITVKKQEATFEELKNGGYDAVIIAQGGKVRRLTCPGKDNEIVTYAVDYLGGKKVAGQKAVVVGGGITGAETALELLNEGKDVTVVEMADQFLGNPSAASQACAIAISQTPIKVLTALRLESVEDHQAVLVDRWGNHKILETDAIVVAAGFIPQHELADQLEKETDMEVFNIGDSKRVRQIYDAIHEAYRAVKQI